ncbi:ATP-binding cassette domain-containing protein [Bradyrhizobium yuanmingense]|uniref:ABC transporter ATP-binding protein n=1 Tax=Bradyrhizobium TaxID=374 RepID=UPI00135F28CE|nr:MULTISPECIES: ABC transporter ATP-binding protein [Bradyrhizobium]MDF0516716.1 ABC transporter ATP-binding protein [Bradyrhizobium yuanmingense]MVT53224.1 ATP-binding cassette domain-containing protein [Bradyrhizobium yuanmingense]UWU67725.1 ABC transporter ATP-binding protein [Bradyrhizobium sp. NC92]
MPELLDIKHLDAGYGRSQVLFGVSIAIPPRGGVAVLGRNGAGKSTLLKTIIGELPIWKGEVQFDGRAIKRRRTEERVRAGIGYVPQEHSVFARLSVRDNLAVGSLFHRDASAMDRVIGMFPKLGQRLDQPAGTLSGGERKMLAIARAMLGKPKLLLLDEPTEGVWIGVIEEITERLSELARDIAVIIVEQHLDLAMRVADHTHVLDRGRLALSGPSRELRADPRLLTYLAP